MYMSVCLCVGICKCVQVPVIDMGEDFMELESQGVVCYSVGAGDQTGVFFCENTMHSFV